MRVVAKGINPVECAKGNPKVKEAFQKRVKELQKLALGIFFPADEVMDKESAIQDFLHLSSDAVQFREFTLIYYEAENECHIA